MSMSLGPDAVEARDSGLLKAAALEYFTTYDMQRAKAAVEGLEAKLDKVKDWGGVTATTAKIATH